MQWRFKLNQVKEIATAFWKKAGNAKLFAFHGLMGSGKTTFIHALCDARQVKDVVGSPTFSIINEYVFIENGLENKILHIDLYRLKDAEEARQAGVEDCFHSGHICLVEWPEKAPGLFPAGTVHCHIETVDEQTRLITIPDK